MQRRPRKRRSRCSASSGMSSSPLAQRRQANFERVDAEHQVFAEIAGLDHLRRSRCVAQTTRTSTSNASILAHAANFAAFQHAQQLGLHRLGQLADLVEEDRAAVGDFEQPDAVFVGAGERPFAMAEQLALDQRFGQGAAVDGHERLSRAQALIVHRAGDQFLAGAGLAQDQHRGVASARLWSISCPHVLHAGGCRRPARSCLRPLQLPLQRPVLVASARASWPRASAAPRSRPACKAWSGNRTRRAAARRRPSRATTCR